MRPPVAKVDNTQGVLGKGQGGGLRGLGQDVVQGLVAQPAPHYQGQAQQEQVAVRQQKLVYRGQPRPVDQVKPPPYTSSEQGQRADQGVGAAHRQEIIPGQIEEIGEQPQ